MYCIIHDDTAETSWFRGKRIRHLMTVNNNVINGLINTTALAGVIYMSFDMSFMTVDYVSSTLSFMKYV